MKKLSQIAERLKLLIEKSQKTLLVILLTAIGGFLTIFNEAWEAVSKVAPKASVIVNPGFKSIFSPHNSNDSINILVARFENAKSEDAKNCFGLQISERIHRLKFKKKLPINCEYVDSISSPSDPSKAKQILNKNNAELLIYGLFKRSGESFCDSGSVCFRTTSFNFLEALADSNDVTIDKYPDDYSPFYLSDVEKGLFSLDTLAFDSWIQSLIVLKNRGKSYNEYVDLYKIKGSTPDSLKVENYKKRAFLNISIENYYDAITDLDSVLELKSNLMLSFTKENKINTVKLFFNFLKQKILPFQLESDDIRKKKYLCLMLLGENELALKKINYELNRILEIRKPKVSHKPKVKNIVKKNNVTYRIMEPMEASLEIYLDTEEIYQTPLDSTQGKPKKLNDFDFNINYDVLLDESTTNTISSTIVDLSLLKTIMLFLDNKVSEGKDLFKKSKESKMRDLVYLSALLIATAEKDSSKMELVLNEAQKEKINIEALVKFHNRINRHFKINLHLQDKPTEPYDLSSSVNVPIILSLVIFILLVVIFKKQPKSTQL